MSPPTNRHFSQHVRALTGCLYGRRMYEIMHYWDDDSNVESAEERDFAVAWRSQPKWVVSRSLKSVGPNATLVKHDPEAFVRELKANMDGEIDVALLTLMQSSKTGNRELSGPAPGEQEVMVLPITHSAPQHVADAIEIPPATKQRLGLDSERSWIVITEANEFVWPGPDLRPVPGRLPPKFFAHVRDRFIERIQRDESRAVRRTE